MDTFLQVLFERLISFAAASLGNCSLSTENTIRFRKIQYMKFKSAIIALISLLTVCGCAAEQSNLQKYPEIAQSDFAILGQSYAYVMDISEEGELKRLCSIPLDINSRKLMDWAFV